MTMSTNVFRVQQFVEELNRGNIDSVRGFMADDYFNYSPKNDQSKAYDVYFDIVTDLKAAMLPTKMCLGPLMYQSDPLESESRSILTMSQSQN